MTIMNVIETELPGVVIVEPRVFRDPRGHFLETWNQAKHGSAGIPERFVQDNLSFSTRGVLRGLHYQHPHGQGKLVSVVRGEVFDVAVDIRVGSPSFAKWVGVRLSDATGRSLYIPPGFAHGFVVLSETAHFSYKCTEYYQPSCEAGLIWNDSEIAIDWPAADPVLSAKDLDAPRLRDVARDRLPKFAPAALDVNTRLEPAHESALTGPAAIRARSDAQTGR